MSAQKSFLDGYSMDSSLSGTQMSVLHSNDNSQNETVFDSQPVMAMRPPASSQHTGSSAGEEVRRLHQDHKALKRSLDRLGQEMASSFTSLHEKTSKVNLSVSDLHSDLKKVERSVMFDRDMSSPSVADIELKLSSTVQSLESRLLDKMSVQVGAAIERKINDAMVSLDNTARRWQMESLSLVTGLAEVKGMVKDLQASVETLSAAGSKSSNRATMPLLPPLPFEMGQAQLMPMLLNNDGILAAPNLQPPMGVELPPQMAPMAQAQQAGMCGGHGHSVNSLTLVHPVTDQNTPARTRVFSMRDAIAVVDSAYPYELDDGWPVAPASGNKRPKAQR